MPRTKEFDRGSARPRRRCPRSPGVLLEVAWQSDEERRRGCMAVNAATEFGQSDPEVAALIESGRCLCHATYARLLTEARRRGEVRQDLDVRAAALRAR